MKKTTFAAGLLALTLSAGGIVWAQESHDHSTMQHTEGMTHDGAQSSAHDMSAMTTGAIPTEPGQGAFAAMIEIVAMLRADPETDWNKVDVDGLRNHLVDMDMLMTNAEVTTQKTSAGLVMTASLKGLGGGAVSRMIPAHGPVLGRETGWHSNVMINQDTIEWTVTSEQEFYIIQALGFFGLMTVGDHHQAHHIGMAKGEMVHEH